MLILTLAPLLLIFAFKNNFNSKWIPRKIVHIGFGIILIFLDLKNKWIKYLLYCCSLLTLILVYNFKLFTFSKKKDIGILSYVLITTTSVFLNIPLIKISPLYFSDPFGAIIGKLYGKNKLYENKTLEGSIGVFLISLFTLTGNIKYRIINSLIISMIELTSGKFDNTIIGIYLMLSYYIQLMLNIP